MSLPNDSSPKKKLKKWQIALVVFFVFPIVVALFVGSSSTTTPLPNPSPTPSKEPEKVAQFSAELTRWEPLNPVSGRAVFTIRNIGDVPGAPGTCKVKVEDLSHTYVGYDWITLDNTIQPGAKFMGNVLLKVTKEGAVFVTQGSVTCS